MNQNREAMISVAVGNADSPYQMVDAIIDTGFTGFLSLPNSIINTLKLPWYFRDLATLGDGSEVIFDMYKGSVIWDGQITIIDIAASNSDPLVGMGLLYGFKITIEAIERGKVIIEAL